MTLESQTEEFAARSQHSDALQAVGEKGLRSSGLARRDFLTAPRQGIAFRPNQ